MRCFVLLALVACGETPKPVAAPQPSVNGAFPATVLRGNSAFTSHRLLEEISKIRCDAEHALAMTAARALTGEPPACWSIADQALTVEVFYSSQGYVGARAIGIGNTITVAEGERYRLGKVTITDPEGAPEPGTFTFGMAGVYDRATVRAGIAAVTAHYDAAGFGLATVTPITRLHRETATIDLQLEVIRNRRATISAIEARTHVAPEVLAQLGLTVGAVFSSRAVVKAKQKLRNVTISTQIDDPIEAANRVRLVIESAE
ncbi:MAG: hypothetical protein ABI867_22575 [Kofleriaceae bacterium]